MIKKFFSYYKPHKKLFALDIICSFTAAICSLGYPFVARMILNDFIPNGNLKMIFVFSAVLLGIFLLKMAMNYIIQYWGHILGVRIQGDMRSELFAHLEKLPFKYFDENKTGSIMSRLVSDLFEVSELAHHGPEDTFISLITIIGSFIMMSTIDVKLTLIVFALLPFMLLFAIIFRKRMTRGFKESRAKIAEINASIESSISGIRVAKAYTASEKEIEKFEKANGEFKKARSAAYKNMGIFGSGMGFFRDLIYLVALIASGLFLYYSGAETIGDFQPGDVTAIILYVTMLLNPIFTLVTIFEQIQDGMTGFGRVQEILAIPPEADPENPLPIDRIDGDIEFNNVSFSYKVKTDDSSRVLKNLDLKIKKGSTVALVGPSGGGKTTLCHLIPRFYEIDDGAITIDGKDIRRIKRDVLRKSVGIVAQDVFLFGGTIKENIAYGNLGATDEEIIAAAKRANIDEFVATLPDGYDTEVGERGVKLSGGQKQRISIARAFLKNPPILILDEATSALDNVTEMQIQKSLEELSVGRTTIIVAHRLSTVKNADEIIVLTGDGIAERGTHSQLMENNGIYAHLYSYYLDN